jgi:hypothetical protein
MGGIPYLISQSLITPAGCKFPNRSYQSIALVISKYILQSKRSSLTSEEKNVILNSLIF